MLEQPTSLFWWKRRRVGGGISKKRDVLTLTLQPFWLSNYQLSTLWPYLDYLIFLLTVRLSDRLFDYPTIQLSDSLTMPFSTIWLSDYWLSNSVTIRLSDHSNHSDYLTFWLPNYLTIQLFDCPTIQLSDYQTIQLWTLRLCDVWLSDFLTFWLSDFRHSNPLTITTFQLPTFQLAGLSDYLTIQLSNSLTIQTILTIHLSNSTVQLSDMSDYLTILLSESSQHSDYPTIPTFQLSKLANHL